MVSLILIFVGLFAGLGVFWLALWSPHQIEREELIWLKESMNLEREPRFPAPPPPWNVEFWRQHRSSGLFLVSMISAPIVTVMFWHGFEQPLLQGVMVFFGLAILTLAISDQYSQYLPDSMTLTLMWFGFLAQLFPPTQTVGLQASVVGAALGYSLLWVTGKTYLLIRKQEGLGHGDMKLLAACGAWLGPLSLPSIILIGSVLAIFVQGTKLWLKQSKQADFFAFGPWLAIGAMVSALLV